MDSTLLISVSLIHFRLLRRLTLLFKFDDNDLQCCERLLETLDFPLADERDEGRGSAFFSLVTWQSRTKESDCHIRGGHLLLDDDPLLFDSGPVNSIVGTGIGVSPIPAAPGNTDQLLNFELVEDEDRTPGSRIREDETVRRTRSPGARLDVIAGLSFITPPLPASSTSGLAVGVWYCLTMAPPTAARMAAAKAGRAMYARVLEQEKPMYFTFRQLTQPEFVGGCALSELSMCTNTSAYSEQCGQSVHMRASLSVPGYS